MRYSFHILIMLAVSMVIIAMPATTDTLYLTQADGNTIALLLHGDENYHYMTTIDGQWVKKDRSGNYVRTNALTDQQIAQLTTQGSMYKARAKKTGKRHFPTKGTQKSIVILAQFQDVTFTVDNPQNAFSTMLNQKGYNANNATGSARDYYLASSNGQFNPQFITVGPYTLPHTMEYYGGNNAKGVDRPQRLMQFCRDAVAAADGDIDFSEYDTDNDGYIDNIFIYYAGYSESEGGGENSIWPHQYGVVPDSVIGTCIFDGRTISSYACTAELKGNSGATMCGIGTFCHEFGHVLGLPDYYHTGSKKFTTLGRWDIMDGGGYLNNGNTPPIHSAFNRFCLGWLSPTQINQAATLKISALSQDTTIQQTTQAYLIADGQHNIDANNPNINEYFIIEYRKKTGWDNYLPDSGMIIWHIDYNQQAWDDNSVNNITDSLQTSLSHMRVYIENPNGDQTISQPAAFHNNNTFTPTLWSGKQLDQAIDQIKEENTTCTFDFMGGGIDRSAPVALDPEVIAYNSIRAAWRPINNDKNYDIGYLFTAFTLAGGDTAYIARREYLTDTTYLLSNLKEETIYTYFVSAYIQTPDTAIETFRSNIIKATTTTEKSLKKMPVSIVRNGDYALIYVSKPAADDVLYVFNEEARLLYTISTNDNLVCLTTNQLPIGHIYIFQAGNKYAKIAL